MTEELHPKYTRCCKKGEIKGTKRINWKNEYPFEHATIQCIKKSSKNVMLLLIFFFVVHKLTNRIFPSIEQGVKQLIFTLNQNLYGKHSHFCFVRFVFCHFLFSNLKISRLKSIKYNLVIFNKHRYCCCFFLIIKNP